MATQGTPPIPGQGTSLTARPASPDHHTVSVVEEPGCWPNAVQEWALDAALGDPERAARGWELWLAATEFDRVDRGSYRVLPLVRHNLVRHGIEHAHHDLLTGVARRTWFETSLLVHSMGPTIDRLSELGIEVLALKGLAIGRLFYPSPALRPMSDVDLLVPEPKAEAALRALLASGWRCAPSARLPRPLGDLPASFRRFKHGVALRNEAGLEIDLHWHASYACCWDGADDGFWTRSQPFSLGDRTLRTLDPTDHLLQTCVHGIRFNGVAPMRWVADATMIIDSGRVDWAALVERATELRVASVVADGIEYLALRFGVAVPQMEIEQLRSIPQSRLDRCWFDYQRHGHGGRSLSASDMVAQYGRHMRARPGKGPTKWVGGLPTFVQYLWDLDHLGQTVPAAGQWLWRRIRSRSDAL